MKMFLITRRDADRVALHERLEGAGWRAFEAEEYPVFREWRDLEGAPLTYEEVGSLGVRVLGCRGALPGCLSDWGGLVALDSVGPDGGPLGAGWKLEALRARMDLGFDEARLAPLIEVACGDDPRAAGVVLRTVSTVAYMEPLLRAVAARFDAETERGRYARAMLDHVAPDDPVVIARRRAAAVPGLERLRALREAFHAGDGLLTEALATLLVDDGHMTAEVMAMRGEARRHAGETWRAAIDRAGVGRPGPRRAAPRARVRRGRPAPGRRARPAPAAHVRRPAVSPRSAPGRRRRDPRGGQPARAARPA